MSLSKPKKSASKSVKKKAAQKNISELMRKYEETGKIGTSKPTSKKKAQKQAVAIGLKTAGVSKKKK